MSERSRFTVWITQYALTKGILKFEAEDCFDTSPKMVRILGQLPWFVHEPHWHRTKEAAVAQAEKMRANKIVGLKKQIAKLEAKKF